MSGAEAGAAVAEAVALVDGAPAGADLRAVAVALARQLRGHDAQALAVLALAALMPLADGAFQRVICTEVDRRGLALVHVGLHDATLLEGALAALNIIDQLSPDLRRFVIRQAVGERQAQAPMTKAGRDRRRGEMAEHFLALPLEDRRAFLAWAREEIAA